MIPLKEEYVKGYYLVNNLGDLYCFGNVDFPGTVSSLFSYVDNIVDAVVVGDCISLISSDGNIYSMSHHSDKKATGINGVVSAEVLNGDILLLTSDGKIYTSESELILSISGQDFEFVDFSLTSSKNAVYMLERNGKCHSVNIESGKTTFSCLTEEVVYFQSICSLPWQDGAFCLDSIGGVFNLGSSDYYGSVPEDGQYCLAKKIVSSPTGYGYWIVDSKGMVLPFGDAKYFGHLKPAEVSGEIVAMCEVSIAVHEDKESMFSQLVENDLKNLYGETPEYIAEPRSERYL